MRIYTTSSQEALHARIVLKDWARQGFLSEAQYQRMEPETVSELRTTNIFLRLVLFLFTVIIVGAAVGLFLVILKPSQEMSGFFLLIFAVLSYAAAEGAVSQARLYRYGIEEALAIFSLGFLSLGIELAFFTGYGRPPNLDKAVVSCAAASLSVWIWYRFGLSYAFLVGMIAVIFMPGYWTSSESAQHVIVAGLYGAGLAGVVAVRPRHRFDYLNEAYSLVEAFLWLGIYLAINLQLSTLSLLPRWWRGVWTGGDFSRPFYWMTWMLIWCLPPFVLTSGIRRKDRFVIAAGTVAAVLTLVTNKPYLGWPRHTWDPMLLGVVLIVVALFVRRWLANGPRGIRRGFTADRLSAKHKDWTNVGSGALGLLPLDAIVPRPQSGDPDVRFGGGDSGGGGATSDF